VNRVANDVVSNAGVHQLVPLKDYLQSFELQVTQFTSFSSEVDGPNSAVNPANKSTVIQNSLSAIGHHIFLVLVNSPNSLEESSARLGLIPSDTR
jgi:hypothetical protein